MDAQDELRVRRVADLRSRRVSERRVVVAAGQRDVVDGRVEQRAQSQRDVEVEFFLDESASYGARVRTAVPRVETGSVSAVGRRRGHADQEGDRKSDDYPALELSANAGERHQRS